MSTETLWRTQTAIYAHLSAALAVTTLLAQPDAVYDHVPANSAFPYIVLSDLSARPVDTQQYDGTEVLCTIESYSRQAGQQEIKKIADAISDALHNQNPAISGHIPVLCQMTDTHIEQMFDTQSWRCRQILRLIVEPAAP